MSGWTRRNPRKAAGSHFEGNVGVRIEGPDDESIESRRLAVPPEPDRVGLAGDRDGRGRSGPRCEHDDAADPPGMLDLSRAVVVAPAGADRPRTQGRDDARRGGGQADPHPLGGPAGAGPRDRGPAIVIGSAATREPIAARLSGGPDAATVAGRPEGFRIWTAGRAGPDRRGAGQRCRAACSSASDGCCASCGWTAVACCCRRRSASPRRRDIPVRGHQMGYRPKTNSYDAWDVPQWEQYIRDLAVFGTNMVELIPPRSDDAADSPHFPRPPMEMMIAMSRLLDEYGLDVGIWYPAMEGDYADPKVVRATLSELGRGLPQAAAGRRGLRPRRRPRAHPAPRPDAVPGAGGRGPPPVAPEGGDLGLDPGLRPRPGTRSSSRSSGSGRRGSPAWSTARTPGPICDALRAAVPESYPIRLYPDITHTIKCQFPVADWDLAYSLTEGREPINPRPRAYRTIFRSIVPGTIGFVTYSEGCNDDVNKIVWSGLGWDPDAASIDILRRVRPVLHRPRGSRTASRRACWRWSGTGTGRSWPTRRSR